MIKRPPWRTSRAGGDQDRCKGGDHQPRRRRTPRPSRCSRSRMLGGGWLIQVAWRHQRWSHPRRADLGVARRQRAAARRRRSCWTEDGRRWCGAGLECSTAAALAWGGVIGREGDSAHDHPADRPVVDRAPRTNAKQVPRDEQRDEHRVFADLADHRAMSDEAPGSWSLRPAA